MPSYRARDYEKYAIAPATRVRGGQRRLRWFLFCWRGSNFVAYCNDHLTCIPLSRVFVFIRHEVDELKLTRTRQKSNHATKTEHEREEQAPSIELCSTTSRHTLATWRKRDTPPHRLQPKKRTDKFEGQQCHNARISLYDKKVNDKRQRVRSQTTVRRDGE